MFGKRYWVGLVRGNRWVVAKVSRRKFKLNIHRLSEFDGDNFCPPGMLGEGIDPDLSKATMLTDLKSWLKTQGVPLNKLQLGISCPGVITRIIVLPILSSKDLDKLLTEQVDQYFTLNLADYVVDYRLLNRFEEEGQQRQRVLLAALPKSEWNRLWNLCQEVGFSPRVVDLAADSIVRFYSKVSERGKLSRKAEVIPDMAILDLGKDRVEFVILEHGAFFLYSDLEVNLEGLEEYSKTLSRVEQHSPSSPRKQSNTHSSESESKSESESEEVQSAEDNSGSQILGALELTEIWVQSEMEAILAPVLKTTTDFFNFFAARHFGKNVDCVYITGDYSNYPLVSEIFERGLEIETRVGFPNGWRPYFGRSVKEGQKYWMKYASLYGLAFRED